MSGTYRLASLGGLLLAAMLLSLGLGRYPVPWQDWYGLLTNPLGHAPADGRDLQVLRNVLVEIRLPRVVAAVLIGAALSVSGAAFQSVFMNPLVSPGLLGVLAGASFGAALAMLLSEQWWVVQGSAFLCGLLAVAVAIGLVRLYRVRSLLMLVLGGIISGALFTALLSVVKYLADPYNQLPAIMYWLMGTLSNADLATISILAMPMLTGILALIALGRHLNVLSLGDEEARALGVAVERVRLAVILWATLISALTVVIAGMIGWIGLMVPHMARLMVGPDNKRLLPASALLGAAFLLLVDDLSRLLWTVEVPIGILTELLGIPVFVLLLRNVRKGWG
ncbi:FecCD family ABC transporter permease [Candidatus Methylocalor cossyra]|uniref:Iron(III) dicitrate ABC transporter, permease protein n=1 Tax=Candidatus Methylocalor cossyra TaxID=3108543 RepID=A0ABM9NEG0_9GAMM